MICQACRDAADYATQCNTDYTNDVVALETHLRRIEFADDMHSACIGATHCCCQHKVRVDGIERK